MISPLVLVALLAWQSAPVPDDGGLEGLRKDWIGQLQKDKEGFLRSAAAFRAQGKEDLARSAEASADDLLPADESEHFPILEPVVPARDDGGDPSNSARRESAAAWEKLAGRAASLRRWSLAWRAWRLVLQNDPDHAEARRILGYVPHEGGWATPFAIKQLKEGQVDHPQFGWVPKGWVPHLDRGELPAPINGATGGAVSWLSTARADELRREMSNPWRIDTEHFQIRSNLPLAESIRITRRLEAFHELFCGMMADVLGDILPLVQRMQGKDGNVPASRRRSPHELFYFSDKAAFVEYLASRHRIRAEQALGVYLTAADLKRDTRRGGASFFYKDERAEIGDEATLMHEVSHQLLFESGRKSLYLPTSPNYWVFEGLGTYFETISWMEGRVAVGVPAGPRLVAARGRIVDLGQAVPLDSLSRMNREEFSNPQAVHLHYAESMALTMMLMQRERGRWREAFLDFAREIYNGQVRRNRGQTLADRLGLRWEQLDEMLREDLAKRMSGPPRSR